MSDEAGRLSVQRRPPSPGRTSLRCRALCRLPECVLLLSACPEPQLARADLGAARAELTAMGSERTGARAEAAPSRPVEPSPVQSAEPPIESLDLRVSYRAPRECPSSGAFLDALQRHVAAGGGGGIDAHVSIVRASESEFELSLRLQVAGKSSESTTRAESCLALMQLAALSAAMARTPEEHGGLTAPAVPNELAPHQSREEAAVEAEVGGRQAPAAGARALGLRPFVLGEIRTQGGMLPQQTWGQGVSAGVEFGALSLRLSGAFWRSQQASFAPEQTSEVSLKFEQRSLELAPCVGYAPSRLLRFDGCAPVAAHRVSTAELSRTIATVGAAAVARVSPWRGLRIELEGGVSVALDRPMFGVQADPRLYQPELLQPGARVALGWDFGGGT